MTGTTTSRHKHYSNDALTVSPIDFNQEVAYIEELETKVESIEVSSWINSDIVYAHLYGDDLNATTINAAIADIGTGKKKLYLISGEWIIDAMVNILSNIELLWEKSTILSCQGSYRVRFHNGQIIPVELFGAIKNINVEDFVLDSYFAIQCAIDAYDFVASASGIEGQRWTGESFLGGGILISGMYNVTDELRIKYARNFNIITPGKANAPFSVDVSFKDDQNPYGLRYIGTQTDVKAILYVESNVQSFSIPQSCYFDSNDLCAYGLYLKVSGRTTAPTEPVNTTKGSSYGFLSFRGYRSKGLVVGDHRDELNAGEMHHVNIQSLRFLGGAIVTQTNNDPPTPETTGLHLNAQNLELLTITDMYSAAYSSPKRNHKHHIKQVAGGLRIVSLTTTRAGFADTIYGRTATAEELSLGYRNVTGDANIPWALYTADQCIIDAFRSEDRWLILQPAVGQNAPNKISNIIQRPRENYGVISEDNYPLSTLPTDQVVRLYGTGAINHIDGIINGSMAIGAAPTGPTVNKCGIFASIMFQRTGITRTFIDGKGEIIPDLQQAKLTGWKYGKYTIECTSISGGGVFSVTDPDSINIGSATVNVAFTTQLKFTIVPQGNAFIVGDKYYLTVYDEPEIQYTSSGTYGHIHNISTGKHVYLGPDGEHDYIYNGETMGSFKKGSNFFTRTNVPQLTSDVNDLDIGYGTFYRIDADADRSITGIKIIKYGQYINLINVSNFNITLKHLNSGSLDGNRLLCHGGHDLILYPNDIAVGYIDISSNKWRIFKICDPYKVNFGDGGPGKIFQTAISGVVIQAITGSSKDLDIRAADGTGLISVITGTNILALNRRIMESMGSNLTAGNDLPLTNEGNFYTITGDGQINGIMSTGVNAGTLIDFLFTGTPLLKHNTAAGVGYASLKLNGSSDFLSGIDVTMSFRFDGTYWHEISRKNPYDNTGNNNITTKTSDYTLTLSDSDIVIDGTTNSVTITLPLSPIKGLYYNISCINSIKPCYIYPNGKSIYNNSLKEPIYVGENISLKYDGTRWITA